MSKNLIRKTLAFLMTLVMTGCLINVNTTRADVEIPDENKYASILPLFKTVDETIQLLIERADKGELEDRVYFVKSDSETLDTSEWGTIVEQSSGEYIHLNYSTANFYPLEFCADGIYYHTVKIGMSRAGTTPSEKKEVEAKVKYIKESLGLSDSKLCNYEKAALLYNYVVNNMEYDYSEGLHGGQTAYEGLILGQTVCAGYTRSYITLLNSVGIRSLYIRGNRHAWNLVEIDDKWYFCDATGGSAGLCVGGDYNGTLVVSGFLLGSIEDSKIAFHEIDTKSNKVIDYYKCSISDTTLAKKEPGMSYETLFKMYDYKEPSCTESGGYRIECDYCNSEHTITIPPTHYYTYTTTKEPTCDEAGSCTATCTLCGHSKEESIPKHEHSWDYRYKETTCEEDGYEKVWCEKCDKPYWSESTKASGHDWGEWISSSERDYKRTCSRCGDYQIEYKVIIDGEATADDLIKKDRGYGIIAYYDILSKRWVAETEDGGSRFLSEYTRIYIDSINENVKWDFATHTFVKAENEYEPTTEAPTTTTHVEPTTPATTKPDTTKPTTTKPTTTKPETTKQEKTTKAPVKTTTAPKKTSTKKQTTTVKKLGKVKNVKVKAKNKAKKNAKKRSLEISWGKVSGASKYQVQVCKSSKFKKSVIKKTVTKTKYTINGLKANQKYYVRVRAIKGTKKNKVYGKWLIRKLKSKCKI